MCIDEGEGRMGKGKNMSAEDLEKFEFLGDVPVTIVAELDRRTISFRELLDLRPGSVIALTRPAGENIDVYVGGVLIGYGELLVVESSLAVRLADLRDKAEDSADTAHPHLRSMEPQAKAEAA